MADDEDGLLETLQTLLVQRRICGYSQLIDYVEANPRHYPIRVHHSMDSIRVGDRFVDAEHPEQGINVVVLAPSASTQVQAVDAQFMRWRYRVNHKLFTWVNLYAARYYIVHVDAKLRGALLWE